MPPRPEELKKQKLLTNRGLSPEQTELMGYKADSVWLHNVGFVSHSRFFKGMGQIMLPGAESGKVATFCIENRVAFAYDKGDRKQGFIIHTPLEIAEDFLGISRYGFRHPTSDLTKQGCFMTTVPLSELPKNQSDKLIIEANEGFDSWCQAKVMEADSNWSIPSQRICISEIQRKACLYLDAKGILLAKEHQWVGRSNASAVGIIECHFCGSPLRKSVKKCPHCQEWQPGMKPAA